MQPWSRQIYPRGKTKIMKERIAKLDFIKIKNFCSAKDNVKRMRRQATGWEKTFAKDTSDKELSFKIHKEHFSSVAQLCLIQRPVDCSTPGLPVHHQLPELVQTHVHRVSDAIQTSHPLSSPSFPSFNHSQHQGLFR